MDAKAAFFSKNPGLMFGQPCNRTGMNQKKTWRWQNISHTICYEWIKDLAVAFSLLQRHRFTFDDSLCICARCHSILLPWLTTISLMMMMMMIQIFSWIFSHVTDQYLGLISVMFLCIPLVFFIGNLFYDASPKPYDTWNQLRLQWDPMLGRIAPRAVIFSRNIMMMMMLAIHLVILALEDRAEAHARPSQFRGSFFPWMKIFNN